MEKIIILILVLIVIFVIYRQYNKSGAFDEEPCFLGNTNYCKCMKDLNGTGREHLCEEFK
jgi:hypothetical protein